MSPFLCQQQSSFNLYYLNTFHEKRRNLPQHDYCFNCGVFYIGFRAWHSDHKISILHDLRDPCILQPGSNAVCLLKYQQVGRHTHPSSRSLIHVDFTNVVVKCSLSQLVPIGRLADTEFEASSAPFRKAGISSTYES